MNSQLLAQDYELVPIDQLHNHPDNPRRGATEHIARSVATHGFYGAVVAQRSTVAFWRAIIAGRQQNANSWRRSPSSGWMWMIELPSKSSSAITGSRISPVTLTTLWPLLFLIYGRKMPWTVRDTTKTIWAICSNL